MFHVLVFVLSLSLISCITNQHEVSSYITSHDTVKPGTFVFLGKEKLSLAKGSLSIGDNLLKKAKSLRLKNNGKVAILNIIPDITTPTCEAQTHLLSKETSLGNNIEKIVISRNPQKVMDDFANEAGLNNLNYFSDSKSLRFGKKSGLLIKSEKVLTRGVIVIDRKGIIRYMQIVPNVNHIPDIKKAFDFARSLLGDSTENAH